MEINTIKGRRVGLTTFIRKSGYGRWPEYTLAVGSMRKLESREQNGRGESLDGKSPSRLSWSGAQKALFEVLDRRRP